MIQLTVCVTKKCPMHALRTIITDLAKAHLTFGILRCANDSYQLWREALPDELDKPNEQDEGALENEIIDKSGPLLDDCCVIFENGIQTVGLVVMDKLKNTVSKRVHKK